MKTVTEQTDLERAQDIYFEVGGAMREVKDCLLSRKEATRLIRFIEEKILESRRNAIEQCASVVGRNIDARTARPVLNKFTAMKEQCHAENVRWD